jgi:hypothetical protein
MAFLQPKVAMKSLMQKVKDCSIATWQNKAARRFLDACKRLRK